MYGVATRVGDGKEEEKKKMNNGSSHSGSRYVSCFAGRYINPKPWELYLPTGCDRSRAVENIDLLNESRPTLAQRGRGVPDSGIDRVGSRFWGV